MLLGCQMCEETLLRNCEPAANLLVREEVDVPLVPALRPDQRLAQEDDSDE